MHYRFKKKTIPLAAALIALSLLGVFGFALGNMRNLLFGTPLSITTAIDGATLTDGFLPIRGVAKHARAVSVNGRGIFLDRDGNFADGVILSPGYNIVEISLRDQFGKERTKTYHLVLSETDTVAQIPDPSSGY